MKRLLLAAALAGAGAAHAASAEQQLLAALRKAHPGTHFDTVVRTPMRGLYAVWMGENVGFVGAGDTRHIVFGRMFDTVSMRDLTSGAPAAGARSGAAAAGAASGQEPRHDPASLPLADAIKRVNGSGARTLVVFTDPACPYCRQLEASLDALQDVTIYLFMVPYQGRDLPRAVWCAPDRLQAWRDAMAGAAPAALPAGGCADALERNTALAATLQIRGTPTMLFADGSRLESYAAAAEIDSRLAAQPVKDIQP